MINEHVAEKVTADHLRRSAYLYVRQSTLRQVMENTTSTDRQYGLRQRAVALGWSREQVVVIDEDLGRSGASSAGREGFQRLVADVGMGKAGIVIGLEVSRLARNNADWHRLLEICALTETLILDEDGLYDPCTFNDRLLLGLKGQMSEAELHLLKARLRGGQLSKARSGELVMPLPVGLVYDATGRVVLDPDQGVRDAVTHLFATFVRTGSARATVKEFASEGLRFPSRVQSGPNKATLGWIPLKHHRVLQVLHNPRYAGAFAYGRRRQRHHVDGRMRYNVQPRESWIALIPDAHAGYISWEQYERNLAKLAECAQARGEDRRKSPPREGPALLQGIVVCARCGKRMTVRYHTQKGVTRPEYVCQRQGIEDGTRSCAHVPGDGIDTALGDLLIATVTPLALDTALAVQAELEGRAAEADALRRQHVERARHAAEATRRRYLAVDPDNRLVAANLEADWNNALRALNSAQEDYERQSARAVPLADDDRARISALATDFPKLWFDPRTPQRERKRMVRLLVEDVTLARDGKHVAADVRLRAGQTTRLEVTIGLSAYEIRRTPPEVVAEVDRLLDDHTEGGVASELNRRGVLSGTDQPFNPIMVNHIRRNYGLQNRFDRLRKQGLLTLDEMVKVLDVHPQTVKRRAARGQIASVEYNDKNQRLYMLSESATMIPCARCGTPIPERGTQGQRQKYCGVTCRTGAYAARRRASGWKRSQKRGR
jgi:DNA invertase Pin-like site-specific DNA recombinase